MFRVTFAVILRRKACVSMSASVLSRAENKTHRQTAVVAAANGQVP